MASATEVSNIDVGNKGISLCLPPAFLGLFDPEDGGDVPQECQMTTRSYMP
jgi:hypothetical protein